MNELINKNELEFTTSNQIVYLEKQIAELKAIEDEIKAKVLEEMAAKGLKKVENEELCITYIDATYRETFDSKAFKTDHEDLYNDYIKMSDVKASVRFKVKDGTSKS